MSEAIDRDDVGTLMATWGEVEPAARGSDAAATLGMLEGHHGDRTGHHRK